MRLSELLTPSLITTSLEATDKDEAFEEMVSLMVRAGAIKDRQTALERLRAREARQSTGVVPGLALPHARLAGIPGVVVALGISPHGIDYDAMDHRPVHVIIMLFSEEGNPGPHIIALGEISRLFSDHKLLSRIREASAAQDIIQLIKAEE